MTGHSTSRTQQRSEQQRYSSLCSGCTSQARPCRRLLAADACAWKFRAATIISISVWLLLAAAAPTLAQPAAGAAGRGAAAAAEHHRTALNTSEPATVPKQPTDERLVDGPAVPAAASAVLPPEHPISKVVSCLGTVEGPITPANYTAYEEKQQVARLLPSKLWQSTKPPQQQQLTICTTMTTDRLDMLDAQCASWPGPLSAVVYVPVVVDKSQLLVRPGEFSAEQSQVLQAARAAVQGTFDRAEADPRSCVLTVLLSYEYVQQEMARQLPVNSLRNQALLLAQTPMIALLDADVMPSLSTAQALADPEQAKELRRLVSRQKHFIVLPAYEPTPIKESLVERMSPAARGVVLSQQHQVAAFAAGSDKSILQRLLDGGMLQTFDKLASPFGHNGTEFWRWLACREQRCRSYEIKPESERFEPWGVLDRQQALQHAPYDEVYRGYGKNKISNVWWLREQGFKLFVHGTAFIVHRPHAISSAKYAWRKEFRQRHVRLPTNTRKFNTAMAAMKAKTYAPKLDASTAACTRQELFRISR